MAIFAVFERLFRCGCENGEVAGAPIRPALVSATNFATSDFSFSWDFGVDTVPGLVMNRLVVFDGGDDWASAAAPMQIISKQALTEWVRFRFMVFLRRAGK